jgi:autotransporter-associated beta strand protein
MRRTSLLPRSFSLVAAGILAAALICSAPRARAGSATWDLDPGGGGWNSATNWTPVTVPNGPSDVATFSVSNRTDVTIASSVEVSAIDFTAGASAFNISAGPGATLTISGPGVSNASGSRQTFTAADNENGSGEIIFMNSATAGDGNTYKNKGNSFGFTVAATEFLGTSNAGASRIINFDPGKSFQEGGFTAFFDQSSAANSTIINQVAKTGNILDAFGTSTSFYDNSTAGNSILIAEGNTTAFGDDGSGIGFLDQSTADHATITIEGGGPEAGGVHGGIGFGDTATAGNASITIQGAPAGGNAAGSGEFYGSATAGSATIVIEGGEGAGAFLEFFDTSSGGLAAFTVNGNALLDISFHSALGMAVGSLAGDGIVHVGSLALTIGTNNQNAEFAGTIQDSTSHTGSLVKTGTGRLSLSGANPYGGGTTVNGGTLLASNTTGSATGTGPVTVNNLATLGGNGTVAGAVTIASGGTLAPAAGPNRESTFTTQGALALAGGSKLIYTARGKGRTVSADTVVANGVTISGATFIARVTFPAMLQTGTVLTVIENTSASPIAGTFANLPDQSSFTAGGQTFIVSYEGGDGNDLTLTAVQP